MIRCDVGPLGRCIHFIGFGVGKKKRHLGRGVDISLGMDSRDVAACDSPCICSKVWVEP